MVFIRFIFVKNVEGPQVTTMEECEIKAKDLDMYIG